MWVHLIWMLKYEHFSGQSLKTAHNTTTYHQCVAAQNSLAAPVAPKAFLQKNDDCKADNSNNKVNHAGCCECLIHWGIIFIKLSMRQEKQYLMSSKCKVCGPAEETQHNSFSGLLKQGVNTEDIHGAFFFFICLMNNYEWLASST